MTKTEEIWKIYPNNNNYKVSNIGRVQSLDRFIIDKNGVKRFLKGKILSLTTKDDGYLTACIFKKIITIQSLVLETFVSERPKGNYARHLNGDVNDNRLINLSWGTPKENYQDTINLYGKKAYSFRLNKNEVMKIIQNINPKITETKNIAILAKKFKVHKDSIRNILCKRTHKDVWNSI